MSYSKEIIADYFRRLFFDEVIPEIILCTNNPDVENKLNNFSNFCIKYSSYKVKNRVGNLYSLANYSSTFRIKPLYHDLFGKRLFNTLSRTEQEKWNKICEEYGLFGINKDYGLQNVIHEINIHDIEELSHMFYENPELFDELKMYIAT